MKVSSFKKITNIMMFSKLIFVYQIFIPSERVLKDAKQREIEKYLNKSS